MHKQPRRCTGPPTRSTTSSVHVSTAWNPGCVMLTSPVCEQRSVTQHFRPLTTRAAHLTSLPPQPPHEPYCGVRICGGNPTRLHGDRSGRKERLLPAPSFGDRGVRSTSSRTCHCL